MPLRNYSLTHGLGLTWSFLIICSYHFTSSFWHILFDNWWCIQLRVADFIKEVNFYHIVYCFLLLFPFLHYVSFKLLNWIGFTQSEYLAQLTNHDVRYLLYKLCVSSSRCSWCLPVNSSADVLYPSVHNQSLCLGWPERKHPPFQQQISSVFWHLCWK